MIATLLPATFLLFVCTSVLALFLTEQSADPGCFRFRRDF
jgi:hypothetical protein